MGERAFFIVVERDLPAASDFDEADAHDVGPQCKGFAREVSPGARERGQIDGDRTALRDVEAVVVTGPIAVDQLIGDLVVRADWRRRIEFDLELVAAGVGVVERADVDVIGAGARRDEADLGVEDAAKIDVVILVNDVSRGVADPEIGIGQRQPGERDGDLLAGRELELEPVVIADDLERARRRASDGDARAGRAVVENVGHCALRSMRAGLVFPRSCPRDLPIRLSNDIGLSRSGYDVALPCLPRAGRHAERRRHAFVTKRRSRRPRPLTPGSG